MLGAAMAVLSYGVLFVSTPIAQANAVERRHELILVLLLGVLGIFSSLRSRRRGAWLLVLLPCYVALQIVPLPLALIRVLSPTRAELADSLAIVMTVPRHVTLSVVPSVTFRHLLLVTAYVLVFNVAADALSRLRDRPWLAMVPIIVASLIEAAVGLSQSFTGPSGSFAHGTYPIKNHFAGLLEMALPFAIMWPIAAALRSGGLPLACFGAVVAITLLLGIALSFSRMGIVATVVACMTMGSLAVAASLPIRKRVLGVAAVCAAGLAGFFLFPPLELIQRFSTGDEGRVVVWRDTLRLISAFPVFGCGLGGYESAFTRYKASLPMFDQDYAHNDYLQGLAELGIVGFAIVVLLVTAALKPAIRSIRTRETMYLGLACVGAITAIAVHSAADFNLYVPVNAAVFAWILGISVRCEL